MRRMFAGLLLWGAVSLSAGEVLVAGPETIVGPVDLLPGAAILSAPPSLATDGGEIVAVWSHPASWAATEGSLYAVRLDRNGQPVEMPRLLLGRNAARDGQVRVFWLDGVYSVFYGDAYGKLAALRLTRELEVIDVRFYELNAAGFDVAVSEDEIVAVAPAGLLRLRRDLTVIGAVDFQAPADAALAVTAMADGFAILIARAPSVLAQRLDGAALGELVHVAAIEDSDDAAIRWTGEEVTAAWLACSSYRSCGDGSWVQVARLDERLRRIGEPVEVTAFEILDCGDCRSVLHLEPLRDGNVFLLAGKTLQTRAVRVRQAVTLDAEPATLGPGARALYTAEGRLFAVDAHLAITAIRTDGQYPAAPLEPVAVIPAPPNEMLQAAAASPAEVAVFRRRPGQPGQLVGSVVTHDGAPLREVAIPPSMFRAGVASDGQDLYALFTGLGRPLFQKLTPGVVPALIYPFSGRAIPLLAWTGSAFATVWDSPRQVWLITPEGRYVETWCEGNENLAQRGTEVQLAAGGGEVVLAQDRLTRLAPDSCPPFDYAYDPSTGWYPRVAYQNGVWAAIGGYEDSRTRLAFARDGGPFVPSEALTLPYSFFGTALAPAGGSWIMLHASGPVLLAAVLDAGGRLLHTIPLTDLYTMNTKVELLPLNGREVLAVYTRNVVEPPYYGASRVVTRRLTVAPSTRRRGVRQ